MTNDQILSAIEFMRCNPQKIVDDKTAEVVAYYDWALSNLYFRIADNPTLDPMDIIFDFQLEMLFYSQSKQSKNRRVNSFKIAYETAQDVLLMFEYPKEE